MDTAGAGGVQARRVPDPGPPTLVHPAVDPVEEQGRSSKSERAQGAVHGLVLNGDAGVNLHPLPRTPRRCIRKGNFCLRSPPRPRGPAARSALEAVPRGTAGHRSTIENPEREGRREGGGEGDPAPLAEEDLLHRPGSKDWLRSPLLPVSGAAAAAAPPARAAPSLGCWCGAQGTGVWPLTWGAQSRELREGGGARRVARGLAIGPREGASDCTGGFGLRAGPVQGLRGNRTGDPSFCPGPWSRAPAESLRRAGGASGAAGVRAGSPGARLCARAGRGRAVTRRARRIPDSRPLLRRPRTSVHRSPGSSRRRTVSTRARPQDSIASLSTLPDSSLVALSNLTPQAPGAGEGSQSRPGRCSLSLRTGPESPPPTRKDPEGTPDLSLEKTRSAQGSAFTASGQGTLADFGKPRRHLHFPEPRHPPSISLASLKTLREGVGKVYLKEENLGSGRLQAKKWLLRNFFENLFVPCADPEGNQLGSGGMEALTTQLGPGREGNSSPNSKQELQPYSGSSALKPNQVGETSLYGVPIVSLVIDGQERLCLAQISNTLLKNYSYNEIHNRRVALGITCVQCTPVQLEILRRAGAMPISSRRCGMITKREAERLCKSFLGEHKPPKLPENFAFDVVHECAWGSRGSFIPARYNSSRAKCIKCGYCSMYFSPNKFIFHSHRTPDAKYTQPDAANFNSWRRHLKLSDKSATDELSHAWEDRGLGLATGAGGPAGPGGPGGGAGVRSYPVIPVPSKGFGLLQKLPPPLFPHPYGFPTAFGLCPKKDDPVLGAGEPKGGSYVSAFRPVVKDAESIAKLYGSAREAYGGGPARGPGPGAGTGGGYVSPDFLSEGSSSYHSASPDVDTADEPEVDVESNRFPDDEGAPDEAEPGAPSTGGSPNGDQPAGPPSITSSGADAPTDSPEGGSPRPRHRPGLPLASRAAFGDLAADDMVRRPEKSPPSGGYELREACGPLGGPAPAKVYAPERDEHVKSAAAALGPAASYLCAPEAHEPDKEDNHSTADDLETRKCYPDQRSISQPSPANTDRGEDGLTLDVTGTQLVEKDIENLARDELQKLLLEQMELRKKLEREFQSLKDNFQDQMKRELAYREEMVQQLQIVRDTLCNELDQERKARYAIQQKLKEAHDALHHFSCKMLTPRHCTGNCSFKPPLLP
ncbi:PREDICTED: SKI family transcriptional corepressor 1 [Capra hircus]|uniref:SKI family transcriptional corepressor 1 n=1 Tax=Capra hircus TaxID=9925 RepID=UPI000847D311|nr:PREDICTED: SKI family transcriptional corepressor 1 [Capra hircus]